MFKLDVRNVSLRATWALSLGTRLLYEWQVIVEQRWLGSKLINCLDLCQKYKRRGWGDDGQMWLGGNWWFQFLDWDHKEPPEMGRSWLAAWLLGSWQPILDTPATWELPRRPCWTLLNNLGSKKEPKKLIVIWWDASHGKNLRSGMLSTGRI